MGDIFNVKYNEKLDRLEIPKKKSTIGLWKFVKKHKFFSVACTSFLTLSFVNFYLIYTFMKVLQNI
mgnify:FL=1